MSDSSYTLLDLVKLTDNVPYPQDSDPKSVKQYLEIEESCFSFFAHDQVSSIGLIVPQVAEILLSKFPDTFSLLNDESNNKRISLNKSLDTFELRNQAMARVASTLKEEGYFKSLLDGWRNELYAIYNPSKTTYMLVERAATPLFGVITYGVHINGYIPSKTSNKRDFKMWIPRRSYTKATFPGMLDNTVAGGLGYPHGLYETAVKECGEEAGFDESFVKTRLVPAGAITYWYRHQYEENLALFQPECEYIYDLIMSEDDPVPSPVDGEVAEFNLFTSEQVFKELSKGSFKPNTAMVIIDFFIRHSIIDPEAEPDYLELACRTHRKFPYPTR